MRVYLPATLPVLAGVLRAAEIGPAPVQAYTVTPALREWYASADMEELEYAALMYAARASLRLLRADPDAPRRRVVLAADVPDEQAGRGSGFDGGFEEPTLVLLAAPVPLARARGRPRGRRRRQRRGRGAGRGRRRGRRRAVRGGRGGGARPDVVRDSGTG